MTTNTINSKYQTWQPWINEYHRLTMAGHSHRKAAELADDYIDFLKSQMQAKLADARHS